MRGIEAIRHLQERTWDLRCQDMADFRRWLRHRLRSWERDPVFIQRERIRQLKRAHPELVKLEKALRTAARAEREDSDYPRILRLERELHKTRHAVESVRRALPDHPRLQARLALLQQKRDRLEGQLRRPLTELADQLQELKHELGIDAEEAHLHELQRTLGKAPGRKGKAFEVEALGYARAVLVPELGAERVLTGVTLGAADTEFDQVLVRGRDPVEVVAVVEAKRNPNDLARGYLHRHASLAWLQGKLEDVERFRTAAHPSGRFEKPFAHQGCVFAPESFANVRELHLISRPGPLWGADGRALARMAFRLSTDVHWRADKKLQAWCVGLTAEFETPDLLKRYEADPDRLILISHQGSVRPFGSGSE